MVDVEDSPVAAAAVPAAGGGGFSEVSWARTNPGVATARRATNNGRRARSPPPVRPTSILIEELLDVLGVAVLEQGEREQDARLLRVELVGGDGADLVVVDFDVAA